MGIQRIESTGSFYSNRSGNTLELSHRDDDIPILLPLKLKNPSESDSVGLKGATLSWHDLSAYVPTPRQGIFQRRNVHQPFKRVLNNVTGIVHPGTMMAVLGASGAGKTTLLNVLAKRVQENVVINGDIRVNGLPIGKFMRKISGYVYQEDLFFSSLTVLEHLNFMARMKLDRRLTKWERTRQVEELLTGLGLKKCEHTRIERISGGEMKRLSFASEAISGCPVLFGDECTTGLDSFSAQRIVSVMQNLAKEKGKTIMCTIHQPSSQVFAMFDQVCLLVEGRTAYLGDTKGAMNFFAKLGHICPDHYNPADFYIRSLAVLPGMEKESRHKISLICDTFVNSAEYNDIQDEIAEQLAKYDFFTTSISSSKSSDLTFLEETLIGSHIRKPHWHTELFWLTWRSLLESNRNLNVHVVRTVQKIVMALLIGFCFFGVNLDQDGIQNIQGAIFIFITENTFPSMYGVLHVFPHELPLFLRENKNGVYRVDTYYLAKMISLVPGFIAEPLLFVTVAYWLVGLRATMTAFLQTCLVILLTANTAAACGCFFSAVFDSVSVAITCLIPFDYMLMITGGIFINLDSLPGYLSWSKSLSWFMYANEAMSVSQWANITNISCKSDVTIPCISTGAGVLNANNFDESNLHLDFILLICLYFVFHILAFLGLLIKSYRK
ncbi:protein scarlet isoform X3 [Folsomia candida]|uniref:protein scarlet isoform X3 n=1 Tax=Folsomia candida TaxID=158441 RepID=UPI0016051563|nr:protein scarlet isoform X3 [Folsomia candida]